MGSHLCPDTLYALNRLSEAKAEIDFKNLSDPAYADVRANGGIGIPCFVLEDGTVTRNLETVLK
nr:glutaredoxin [uncultured Fournierella sp.]